MLVDGVLVVVDEWNLPRSWKAHIQSSWEIHRWSWPDSSFLGPIMAILWVGDFHHELAGASLESSSPKSFRKKKGKTIIAAPSISIWFYMGVCMIADMDVVATFTLYYSPIALPNRFIPTYYYPHLSGSLYIHVSMFNEGNPASTPKGQCLKGNHQFCHK